MNFRHELNSRSQENNDSNCISRIESYDSICLICMCILLSFIYHRPQLTKQWHGESRKHYVIQCRRDTVLLSYGHVMGNTHNCCARRLLFITCKRHVIFVARTRILQFSTVSDSTVVKHTTGDRKHRRGLLNDHLYTSKCMIKCTSLE